MSEGTGREDLARKVRAQAVVEKPPARRFYDTVEIVPADGHWRLLLDGRPARTPLKRELTLPAMPLAEAVAAEWQTQEEHVRPSTMPFTRLANTALDRVEPERVRVVDEIVSYANSDLLCYRAERPVELVLLQTNAWDPLLEEFGRQTGTSFARVAGVMHSDQPSETLDAMRSSVEALDSFRIAGLHDAMTLTGSAVMALALTGAPDRAAELWKAAHVDEDWQIRQWGKDAEEAERRALREGEFFRTAEFISLLS